MPEAILIGGPRGGELHRFSRLGPIIRFPHAVDDMCLTTATVSVIDTRVIEYRQIGEVRLHGRSHDPVALYEVQE